MSKDKPKKDALGDRMKRYEAVTRHTLPPNSYTIVRVDGKSFHTHTKSMGKPFDSVFMETMNRAAKRTVKELHNVVCAYIQSDEVSFLLTDFESHDKESYFGGVIQKIASVIASTMTAMYNIERPFPSTQVFDARVFTLPSKTEVHNYFVWRQKDAIRNSISMVAQHNFSHKTLFQKSQKEMLDMLSDVDPWNDYGNTYKYGRLVQKNTIVSPVTYWHKGEEIWKTTEAVPHTEWIVLSAPVFQMTPTLYDMIPDNGN